MNSKAIIKNLKWGFNKNDKEQFVADIEFVNGTEPTGETAVVYMSMEGGAREYTEDTLDKIGFDGDLDNPGFTRDVVEVYQKTDAYGTQWRFSTGGGGLKDAPQDVKRQRAAQMRGRYAANAAKKSSPPKSDPPKSSPPPSEDDPFSFSSVVDRQSAWEKLVELAGDRAEEAWLEAVAGIGKDEADFTAKDWRVVASKGVPF